MTIRSSQRPPSSQGGYISDGSDAPTRRSSRVTTPTKQPGMIEPSPDSWRSIPTSLLSEKTNPISKWTKKQKDRPVESPSEQEITPVNAKERGKNKKTYLDLTNTPSGSVVPDTVQDSNEENAKARPKRQKTSSEFDDPKAFFSEPFLWPGEVSVVSF